MFNSSRGRFMEAFRKARSRMIKVLAVIIAVMIAVSSFPAVLAENAMPFEDVKPGSWYYEYVLWCYSNEVVNGVTPVTFSPDAKLTRATIVTMLWRLQGSPAPERRNHFMDSTDFNWYSSAVEWAAECGVMNGSPAGKYSDGTVRYKCYPNDYATRAQMVQLIENYVVYVSGAEQSSDVAVNMIYEDNNSCDPWRYHSEAIAWATLNGIVNGTDETSVNEYSDETVRTYFNAEDTATRAQFCKVIMKISQTEHYHSFAEDPEITGSTCAELGTIRYTCAGCGQAVTYSLPAVPHSYLITGVIDSTCTSEGRAEYRCRECGKTAVRIIEIKPHSYILSGTKDSTCTADGYKLYICEYCGNVKKDILKATGHSYKAVSQKLPTCTATGYINYKCTVCGQVKTQTVSATGHKWKATRTIGATYYTQGYTVYTCTVCGAVKNDSYTPCLEKKKGKDTNKDGKLTIDEYLKFSGVVEHLNKYMYDYLGTPFESIKDYFYQPWECLHYIGKYPDDAHMNCTGFVAAVTQRCGADLDLIPITRAGSYANGFNWEEMIYEENIYRYVFNTKSEMLASGKLRKGDIIYFSPPAGVDCHFAFFWGDTPYQDRAWHTTYSNIISYIYSATEYNYIIVLPMQGE